MFLGNMILGQIYFLWLSQNLMWQKLTVRTSIIQEIYDEIDEGSDLFVYVMKSLDMTTVDSSF